MSKVKETFINCFGEEMQREEDNTRISVGKFGILCSHWISKCSKELHQPLIQIITSISSTGDYDEEHHLRRLIEVNIPRQKEDLIKQVVKGTKEHLKLHYKRNIDCNTQIKILELIEFCNSISTKERNKNKDEKKTNRGSNS